MSNIQDKIYDEVKNNLKNPKMYAFLLVLVVVVFLLFPYFDANLFYYKRVNDRVDILNKISNLDVEKIQQDPTLKREYESILNELSQQPESTVTYLVQKESDSTKNMVKFITGGLLFWVFAFVCFGLSGLKTIPRKIIGFVICAILGVLLGFIGKAIPNIFTPWVNYIGFPLLQIIFLALLFTSKKPQSTTRQ